jgi:hypothetical protein
MSKRYALVPILGAAPFFVVAVMIGIWVTELNRDIFLYEMIANGSPHARLEALREQADTLRWALFGTAAMGAGLLAVGISILAFPSRRNERSVYSRYQRRSPEADVPPDAPLDDRVD